ncbi:MAG: hypothetical protein DRP74_02780 [Candidatus Omnitrophota bacterium]|nr:MAG: hypothetical protein DRP74_02780 [Candidatus Omnitrophota bacterium]
MRKKDLLGSERRQFIRLDTVLPVQFRIIGIDSKKFLSDWLQGFTNNIGKGGICLAIINLNPDLSGILKNKEAKVVLSIEIPVSITPISASAKVAWVKDVPGEPARSLVGLTYEDIKPAAAKLLISYARAKKLFVPVVLSIIFILGLAFAAGSWLNIKLIKGNKAIVEQLIKIVQESSVAKQKIKEINREREGLSLRLETLKMRIRTVEEAKKQLEEKVKLEEAAENNLKEMSALIQELSMEKESLQQELYLLQGKENAVTEELLRLDKKKAGLEKANLDKMYHWLKIHQSGSSGLVMSFEGDDDLSKWAFIYDQSLAAQVYTNFSDYERAKKIFDFFKNQAKKKGRSFFNAYYADSGEPAEYAVNSGPNIWLGIAILQYTNKSGDYQYLGVAEDIAFDIIYLQNRDEEGGIRGGPDLHYYSTEHNIDAYAFFNMLYEITKKESYLVAREKTLNWIVRHTYDGTNPFIKRGKGDSTIATDTYAFAIAAIGPQRLEEVGMNPDAIIDFAEKKCAVEVSYQRPEGEAITVKGFDFAPEMNIARGGIVSPEWTAQMVVAFKIMSDYYYEKGLKAKGRTYALKADEYLVELSKMIISSPSPSGQGESCLPYATKDFVDTGHGWRTPKGKSTGSVAGTAYTLLAYYNYNPLQLEQ